MMEIKIGVCRVRVEVFIGEGSRKILGIIKSHIA